MTSTPYANLDPGVILDAVESVGFQCTGGLFALNSFENRVYQIGIEGGAPIIAKFYRPARWSDDAILEEHQFALELAGHDIPVVAPLVLNQNQTLHHFQGYRFALFPRQGGRPLEVDNLEHLEWIGRFIGRLHAVGAVRPFEHRIQLNVQTYGYHPYRYLLEQHFIPEEIKTNYCQTVEHLLSQVEERFARVSDLPVLRLHGDCHAGNVLWYDGGPRIVDLDDCLMGPAIQDLWMLLSATAGKELVLQLDCILEGYNEFYDFNKRELTLIEPLRALRMIHYSGWLARRWEDPAFPTNFPWFNTPRYWQEQLQHLREQSECLEKEEELP